jgi:probable HAF family extracellular repeat protein
MRIALFSVLSAFLVACSDITAADPSDSAPSSHAEIASGAWRVVQLGTLGGNSSRAEAINDFHLVVGGSQVASGASHAFVWTPTTGMLDLGVAFGAAQSWANDINNRNEVVGWWGDPAGGSLRAFLWRPGSGIIDLGNLGVDRAVATGINDLGMIAGWSATPDGRDHAFIWTPWSGMHDLGTAGETSVAHGIGPGGTVVGRVGDPQGGRPFRWIPLVGRRDLDFGREASAVRGGVIAGLPRRQPWRGVHH